MNCFLFTSVWLDYLSNSGWIWVPPTQLQYIFPFMAGQSETLFSSWGRSINPPLWIVKGLDISSNLFKITGPLESVHLFLVLPPKPQTVLDGRIESLVAMCYCLNLWDVNITAISESWIALQNHPFLLSPHPDIYIHTHTHTHTHTYIYIYIYISGGPLSALTCCVNVRLLSAIKKISPLIYSQSWIGSWVYTTQAMMTFTLIF